MTTVYGQHLVQLLINAYYKVFIVPTTIGHPTRLTENKFISNLDNGQVTVLVLT
jgi:hypothetical protein